MKMDMKKIGTKTEGRTTAKDMPFSVKNLKLFIDKLGIYLITINIFDYNFVSPLEL